MDTVTISREQAQVLLAGVAATAAFLGVCRGQISMEEYLQLLEIFVGRLRPNDNQWLEQLALQVEQQSSAPGVWH